MARTLFCRHADCGKPYDSIAGDQPTVCPTCGKAAHWTTDPEAKPLDRRQYNGKRPRVPFDVTQQDYRLFLKRIKIAAN